jgi:hypothetical protein
MKTHSSRVQSGFALVVTVSLMVLLSLVAIGMLSLSSIALRSSSQTDAISTARANARLSLMLAIGELQRHAGSDTRVTARADILAAENPPVLGVWRSWEGLNHETAGNFRGRPKAPGYDYRTMKENGYSSGSPGQGRFLAWLTSSNSNSASGAAASSSLPTTTSTTGTVALLGPGSIGTDAERETLQIHLTPTTVTSGQQNGAMAWWVGGENQKAYIPKPERELRGTAGRKQAVLQAKSHATVDPTPFGLESILADGNIGTDAAEVNKALTIGQVDLLEPSQSDATPDSRRSREFFHDLSTSAVGLLTNTATGGWRKDMSLLSEKWKAGSFPDTSQPFFRLSPDPVVDTTAFFATSADPTRQGAMFYPWSQYVSGAQQPVASWNNLMDFVSFYKRGNTAEDNFLTTTSGVRRASAWTWGTGALDIPFRHLHKVRLFPVVARIQWVFSHFSERSNPGAPAADPKLYTPKLLMTPVVTMWNPYNVELTSPYELYFEIKIIPVALSYQLGGAAPNPNYNCVLYINQFTRPTSNTPDLINPANHGNGIYNTFGIAAGMVLKPGETRVFSPASNDRRPPGAGPAGPWGAAHTIDLLSGYRGSGGHVYPVRNTSGIVTAQPETTSIKAHVSFDTTYFANWGTNGVGTYFEVRTRSPEQYMMYPRTGYSVNVANALHPRITGNDALQINTLSELENNPKPFLSTIFGPKIATNVYNTVNKQYSPKGILQSSPFHHLPHRTYRTPTGGPGSWYPYPGTGNPVNYGYEYSYVTHGSAGDDNFPNSGPGDTGYIISGVQSANGVPRAVIADLPARPLASLGELVGWDMRFENPVPPFAFNLVGNSDASPLLSSNAVVNSSETSMSDNLRHDDSYCANHLLFDDWFFSSITDDPATFGGQARLQNVVYGQFLTGETPLANRAYQPILKDQAYVANNPAADLYADYVAPNDSWKTIASRLEVEGMFNVNSTSVAAWRALLRHAKNQRVLHYSSTGSIVDGGVKQHPVSRFSISGEVEAGSAVAGAFPEASEVTGYRTLDEDFLDELAEEVVKQVRLRGPFLSLAEFINRQLSNDKTVALAGALQAALNELTKSGAANNPLAVLQNNNVSTVTVKNPPAGAGEDSHAYVFSDAAEGYSSYGVPGWTRQSDILRPIAPILSARDDTFVIRGYGDTRDGSGNVIANATCEAVVKRTRDYVDPADAAETTATLSSAANKLFGRRFEIVSFRWLAPDEV